MTKEQFMMELEQSLQGEVSAYEFQIGTIIIIQVSSQLIG